MTLALASLGLLPNAVGQDFMSVAKSAFERRVLHEIYAVFPLDPMAFYLDDPRKGAFVLYVDEGDDRAPVECVESASFSIVSYENERGRIAVGRCPGEAGRLRDLMPKAAPGLDRTLEGLRGTAGREAIESLRSKAGWFYEETTLPDGASLHYFPVVVIGHGLAAGMTTVLLGSAQTIVVQAWIFPHLCKPELVGRASSVKLCTDTKRGLMDLALRMR